MSDTPRTDAFLSENRSTEWPVICLSVIEFCRTLELELVSVTADRERLSQTCRSSDKCRRQNVLPALESADSMERGDNRGKRLGSCQGGKTMSIITKREKKWVEGANKKVVWKEGVDRRIKWKEAKL